MARRYLVRTTRASEVDILEARDYISSDSPRAALTWVEEISRALESLGRFPHRGAVIPEAEDLGRELRHLVLGQYRLIYRLEGSTVWVLRVVHGARLLDMRILGGQ